jgi:hypothetical protein
MTDETENLILEHLKRFQSGQERIERDLREVKGRLSQVEIGLAGVHGVVAHLAGDVARLQHAFDGMSERIDRIERRLELA